MANPEHLALLKEGVAGWNTWRVKNRQVQPDLSSANLRSADLSLANLRWADLHSADLRWADLSSANLRSADLHSADLRWADLSWADLRSADLRLANLRLANLRSANLSSIIWCNAKLHGVRFTYKGRTKVLLVVAPNQAKKCLECLKVK